MNEEDLPALPLDDPAPNGVNDWRKEWAGMPEFVQEDLSSYKSVKVHFRNEQDFLAFQELIGQKITPKQKALWFPEWEPRRYAHLRYVDSEET